MTLASWQDQHYCHCPIYCQNNEKHYKHVRRRIYIVQNVFSYIYEILFTIIACDYITLRYTYRSILIFYTTLWCSIPDWDSEMLLIHQQLTQELRSRSGVLSLWLVQSDHVTWILASDWSGVECSASQGIALFPLPLNSVLAEKKAKEELSS